MYGKLATEEGYRKYTTADGPPRGKQLSANTRVRIHRTIRRVLAWGERNGLVARNVASLCEAPKPTKSPARALTDTEAAAILKAATGSREHPFYMVAMSTGARRGEIAALTWDCIDFDRKTVTINGSVCETKGKRFVKNTKSGKSRSIPLTPACVAALRGVKARVAAEILEAKPGEYQDLGFVFASEDGKLPDLTAITRTFTELATELGIKGATLHSARHYFATTALLSGTPIHIVSALLGHSSPMVTLQVYAHVLASHLEQGTDAVSKALATAQAR